MTIASPTDRTSIRHDVPILCLDTCSVLDILRDPTRRDVRWHEQEASLELLEVAESGERVRSFVTDLVCTEFRDNVQYVQDEASRGIRRIEDQIVKLNRLVALHGSRGVVDFSHWAGHVERCRNVAERWLAASTVVQESEQNKLDAIKRLTEARAPARKGKDSTKDCIILETYLELVREIRARGVTTPAVFVSSNTRDYAERDTAAVRNDIDGEFRSLDLEYAPNMGAARHLLGI